LINIGLGCKALHSELEIECSSWNEFFTKIKI